MGGPGSGRHGGGGTPSGTNKDKGYNKQFTKAGFQKGGVKVNDKNAHLFAKHAKDNKRG